MLSPAEHRALNLHLLRLVEALTGNRSNETLHGLSNVDVTVGCCGSRDAGSRTLSLTARCSPPMSHLPS